MRIISKFVPPCLFFLFCSLNSVYPPQINLEVPSPSKKIMLIKNRVNCLISQIIGGESKVLMGRDGPALAQENGGLLPKKMGKTQKIAQKLFLFIAKKEHTQYPQHHSEISILGANPPKEGVGSPPLGSGVIKPIKTTKTLGILGDSCSISLAKFGV